jgi:simple sugar transport system permease protein
VINIGLEGMMTIGAFTGVAVTYFTSNPWAGFLCAGLAGGLLALLHAVACVTFMAEQTVSGIAINFIGTGLSLFLSRLFFKGATSTPPVPVKLPKLINIPSINFNVDITVFLAAAAVYLCAMILMYTKWGLRIRAAGEYPAAVDALGVSVHKLRYVCVVISGILAGFGGASVTLAIISQFTHTAISGQGFIALAAVVFGKWRCSGAYVACILFGFAQALVVMLGGENLPVSSDILSTLPYVLTIIVLIVFVGHSSAPKASGKAYQKGLLRQ